MSKISETYPLQRFYKNFRLAEFGGTSVLQ